MFMILLILDNPDQSQDVLDAWEEAGAPGVTILPSSGLGRVRNHRFLNGELPLMPSLEDFFQKEENQNRTMFSFIRDRAVVDRIIHATEGVVGDLNKPHTGILVVLPLMEAYGLDRYQDSSE